MGIEIIRDGTNAIKTHTFECKRCNCLYTATSNLTTLTSPNCHGKQYVRHTCPQCEEITYASEEF